MSDQYRTGSNDIARLQDTVYGYGRMPGLVDKVERHRKRLAELEQFQRDIVHLKELARWLALALATVIGFLASPQAGQLIGKMIKVGEIFTSSSPR